MNFTQDSFLVQFYIKQINEGFPRENVPDLFNLREVLFSII